MTAVGLIEALTTVLFALMESDADRKSWLETLGPIDAPGARDFFVRLYEDKGAVPYNEAEAEYEARMITVARQSAQLVIADIVATTEYRPSFEIARDQFDQPYVCVTEGTMSDGHTHVDGVDPITSTVHLANEIADLVMEFHYSPWPICPQHNFGSHPQVRQERAVWWCNAHRHIVAEIGQLATT